MAITRRATFSFDEFKPISQIMRMLARKKEDVMSAQASLPKRFLEAASAHAGRTPPPVERWNPAWCGNIDMHIAADGRWFYMGTPITRLPLVKLFASILRHDREGADYAGHVLVTPVERVGIRVEDAPFLAVEMEEMAGSNGQTLAFRTNLDEIIVIDSKHPIRFAFDGDGGFKPYILVRGDLWARATRALALEIAERLEDGPNGLILRANGLEFAVSHDMASA